MARAPHRGPRRGTKPKANPTQQKQASRKDASADLKSGALVSWLLSKQKNHMLAAPSTSELMLGDEDSSEEEMYTDP